MFKHKIYFSRDKNGLGCLNARIYISRAVRAALNPDGIMVAQYNGAPAGQTIFHLHVHILPRWEGDPKGFAAHGAGAQADKDALAALAEEIRAQF